MTRECQSCGSRFCDGVQCYLEEPEDDAADLRAEYALTEQVARDLRFTIEQQRKVA